MCGAGFNQDERIAPSECCDWLLAWNVVCLMRAHSDLNLFECLPLRSKTKMAETNSDSKMTKDDTFLLNFHFTRFVTNY